MDRLLEECRSGPFHLSRPEIAQIVVDALTYGQETLGYYTLHAFVVMPNHVHVLLTPHVAVPKLLRTLKAFTARRANRILGSTGKPFWQDESYDHVVRNEEEWQRIRAYIEQNPLRAGLAYAADQYRWSSAWKKEAGREAGCGPGGPPH